MSLTFTVPVHLNSVLTDADSLPTLNVVRTDTETAVVSAATMTHVSTGIYTYVFSSPIAGVVYRADYTITIDGITYDSSSPDQLAEGAGGGTTTLSTARMLARDALRSGGSSARYEERDFDRWLRFFGNDFVRRTKCVNRSTNFVTLTADDEAVDFSAMTGFRPELLLRANITVDANYTTSDYDVVNGLTVVPFEDLQRAKYEGSNGSGVPRLLTFTSHTVGAVYPPPSSTGTIAVQWVPLFTSWTPGVAQCTAVLTTGAVTSITIQNGGTYTNGAPAVTFSGGGGTGAAGTATVSQTAYADYSVTSIAVTNGGSGYTSAPTVLLDGVPTTAVTLNILDDCIDGVISLGVAVGAQLNEIEAVEKDQRLAAYNAHVQMCAGRGGLGVKQLIRRRPDEPIRQPTDPRQLSRWGL